MEKSSLAIGERGPFTPEGKLQDFTHGIAINQSFAGKQSRLAQSRSRGKTPPSVHGCRQGNEGYQACVRNILAEIDRVSIGADALHAVLVTAEQPSGGCSERDDPESILFVQVGRGGPYGFLVTGQIEKDSFQADALIVIGIRLGWRGTGICRGRGRGAGGFASFLRRQQGLLLAETILRNHAKEQQTKRCSPKN